MDGAHTEAQYRLGMLLAEDPLSHHEAVSWFEKAAAQGHLQACYCVGSCYENGMGVPVDIDKAILWYKKAAIKGELSSQIRLGTLYQLGRDIPKDSAKAAKWFEMAAVAGNGESQLRIGTMYATGSGVRKNSIRAYAWLKLGELNYNINNPSLYDAKLTLEELELHLSSAEKAKAVELLKTLSPNAVEHQVK